MPLPPDPMLQVTLQIQPGGRVVIPAKIRQALGLTEGARLVATLDIERRALALVPVEVALDAHLDMSSGLLADAPNLSDKFVAEFMAHGEEGGLRG